MQVILLEKINNLGDLGQLVNVKPGYARNYLVPKGKATPATESNIEAFEGRRKDLEAAAAGKLGSAAVRRDTMQDQKVVITERASDEGKLFGSVGVQEIVDAMMAAGFELQKSEVRLPDGPIKTVGESEVQVSVHAEVQFNIVVEVVAEA
ncbi:MAG: 50S ribosomal protein L9 [Proteobacteria bacterium]|jgi:large subunit ribosomal protein L9|nr:50S ribosomal protein L9 [Pseudomonadota bacterium]